MGLFSNNKKEEKEDIPRLPELPKLPELPGFDDLKGLPQLPSFPRNSFGEKFSQNTIKDAVSGWKEGEGADAEEMDEEDIEDMQMMPKPGKGKFMAMENDENSDDEFKQFQKYERKVMEAPSFSSPSSYKKGEPIFIRLDKFEESLKIFEKMKQQVVDIEGVLREIKNMKEQEEKELMSWEQEIQNMKKQIEKVDKDLFSRIE